MEQVAVPLILQVGIGGLGLVSTIAMFRFLMTANSEFRMYLMSENKRLHDENKQLRQALFATKDPDTVRLATALLGRSPKTDLGDNDL